jgi:stage III sporulation protein AF
MSLMDGLSGWLKQIVAVVLLASLVDLLLPNRTMQRYVRLVAGLFVLLTVATPMLKWLQSDFGGKLVSELDTAAKPAFIASDELSRIRQEGRTLHEKQNEDTASLVAARLAEQMKADIEQSEKRPVRSVVVNVETVPDGRLSVRGVTVTLESAAEADGPAVDGKEEVKPVSRVEPVAPVTVEVPPVGGTTSETQGKTGEDVPAEPDRPTQMRISAFIAARYGIPADQVVVTQTELNRN